MPSSAGLRVAACAALTLTALSAAAEISGKEHSAQECRATLPATTSMAFDAAADTLKDADSPVVTFSGLRTYEDGSSTLRVDLTKQVSVKLTATGKKLVFLLEGAKVELRNNKNPLRAEYFQSNVVRTQLKDSKKGVLVEIELRKEVTPEYKLMKHTGGAILRIDIPPAQ